MKRIAIVLFVFFLTSIFFTNPAGAGTMPNAPHNVDNSIYCEGCHTNPLPGTSRSDICATCHNGVYASLALTHSNAVIHGAQTPPYADLSFECLDCHDPHFHNQLVNLPDLFLITGTIDADSIVDNGNNTSTLSYSSAVIKAGWNLPPHADNANWGAKTAAGRGLVLAADKDNPDATYEIVSATATQITVNGAMSTSFEGNTFGIMYGMLINDTVDPDGEGGNAPVTVRFYDRSGTNSFADGDGTYDGICEVCHTNTTHFNNDGLGSDNNHTNINESGMEGTNCTSCHTHETGFGLSGGNSCGSCHDNWGAHPTHTEAEYGPKLDCYDCHVTTNYPYLISGTGGDGEPWDLSETDVCDSCHSEGGSYNGVDSTDDSIGARDNWITGIYDSGMDIQAGKERWCVGCHDDVPSVIQGISAPNVAGDDVNYGYYKTGHGKHGNEQAIGCLECHDPSYTHTDGVARTYTAAADNYQSAYRLKDIDGQVPMDIPKGGATTADQFRLCFSCHDSDPFLDNENTNTNFRSDVDDACTTLDPAIDNVNKHNFHLVSDLVNVWDSDWDGTKGDSKMSCPACHNVHGAKPKAGASNAPAMIRTGELIGRPDDSLNLDYFVSACGESITYSTSNETASSKGGMLKWQGMGAGSIAKNGVCSMCHNENEPYWRDPGGVSGCVNCHGHDAGTNFDPDMQYPYTPGTSASMGAGSWQSHSTHTETDSDDAKGPQIYCDTCHDLAYMPRFKNLDGSGNHTLAETDICDNCHSPGGTYDGVNDIVVGVKNNWKSSIYDEASTHTTVHTLKPGKEKWCASCHDEEQSNSKVDGTGVDAPNIVGDEDGSYIYGTGWGYYKTGHGLAASKPYPYKGGLIEPPLETGAAKPVACDSCHDFSTSHIDGVARTFDDGGSSTTDPSVYRQGYRLVLVDDQEPMHIPWEDGASPPNNSDRYRLCAKCHTTGDVFENTTDLTSTNLVTDAENKHAYHLNMNQLRYSSDWDPAPWTSNSRLTCVTCHNVHGSTRLAMVRDGKLTAREPGLMIWYYNDDNLVYSSANTDPPYPENTPLAASDGTIWRGQTSGNLCTHCHANNNTTQEARTPYQTLDQAPTLNWTGEANYFIDGVEPDIGLAESFFEFRIEYTDKNNDLPATIEVWVDEDDNTTYEVGEKYAMAEADPSDIDITDGKIYTVALQLSKDGDNTFDYRFYASDGSLTVEFPTSPDPDATVTVTNNAPTLSWTSEPYYEADGVSPDTGGNGENYDFRITYTDLDPSDGCPAAGEIQVWIDENDNGYEAGEKYNLTEDDGGDTDCTDGKIYQATQTLSTTGAHNYRFYATDTIDEATGDAGPIGDSTVTVTSTANNTPWLEWTEGTCLTDGVKPARGADGADYVFTVTYTDPDNQCPVSGSSDIQVWIDEDNDGYEAGEKYNMTEESAGDTDCTDGKVYTLTRQLDTAGDFDYRFYASDGTDTALGEAISSKVVTVVSAYKVRPAGGTGWYSSIQGAANAAAEAEPPVLTVLVYDGTYTENLTLEEGFYSYEGFSLESVCGPEVTTIEADSGNTVSINGQETITLDGFTISSTTPGAPNNGNGINIYNVTTATIKNCIIEGNTRGINSYSTALNLEDCEIRNNIGNAGNDPLNVSGAGIYINGGGMHYITNCIISGNTANYHIDAVGSGSGGGLFMQSSASVTMTDTTFTGNESDLSGGGIYVNNSTLIASRITVSSNIANTTAGGLSLQGTGSSTLTNCNIVDNVANTQGGGLWLNNHTTDVINTTVSNNSLTDTGSGIGGGMYDNGATVSIVNSIFWNNVAGGLGSGSEVYKNNGSVTFTYSIVPNNIHALVETGSGSISVDGTNIELDPLFVDSANGDYHLKNVSPAIDQGTGIAGLTDDIDGDERPFDYIGVGDGVDDNDMGSDEVTDQATIDSLSTSNPTPVQSGSVDADASIVMSRFQVDCDNTGDSDCILTSVSVEDIATGLSGDWDNLEIYIDTDTDITGATLIGQEASWDGAEVIVLLNQGTQSDRTVTNGTPKYIFIVYDITDAAEGELLKSRVTQLTVLSPDYGVSGLTYESNIVSVNGDTLSTSNHTAVQATDPYAGDQNVVMQRFQADCSTNGNDSCLLSSVTVNDLGTAATGDWDSLDIYIDTDTDFAGATQIGQTSWDGTETSVTLDQGTEADRTITNGTSKYIFIVYDINSGAAGKIFKSLVTGVGVVSPDNGAAGLNYSSNQLTATTATGDSLTTSNPAAVRTEYADVGENEAVMGRFQVDCDTNGDSNCILSSVTVDDLGTASTGDWDNLDIYIDTDTSFTGATKIGQLSSWDGTSGIVSLNLATEGDRTVTNGTSKYVFVVYDLSDTIVADTTLQARVTAVGVASPDAGVTGITYDSNYITVKDTLITVGSGKDYATIQAAVNAASDGDIILVYEGTYTENVNHSPPTVTTVLHIYSANGPDDTIIDGNDSGSVVTFGYRSSTSTLRGFTITNGSATPSIGGAGIYVNMAQPTIDNCIIIGNDAGTLFGGGIHVNNAASDVTITNTIISNNNGGNGGGLYLPLGTKATISNCVFNQNTATIAGAIFFNDTEDTTTITDSTFSGNSSTSYGGAFFMQAINGIKFSRCTITGNHSDDTLYGGGVLRTGNASNATFENCIIADNYAPMGGVFSLNGGAMTLTNCTVANNSATGTGGGIAYICSGFVNMTNGIAWGNSATSGNGHIVYRTCTGPAGANVGTISYSDFDGSTHGSTPYPPYLYQSYVTNGGGNIDPATDPSFDGGGTYHLTSSSTNVIDAGTSSGAPSDDIDGDSRPYNGLYDMGADEYIP